jgi:S-formylglutathione hydrolase FrmB
MQNLKTLLCLPVLLVLLSCSMRGKEIKEAKVSSEPVTVQNFPAKDSAYTLLIDSVKVDILVPAGEIKGDILVLPGWNFSRSDWCEKADLCKLALEHGYRLIMPEMGKSIYARQWYPETRNDWKKFPTGIWLTDTLLPLLNTKHNILKPGGNNFILGLSTGGRGVALTVINTKGIFKAAAALSGDYDQTDMTADNLVKGYYGPYDKFPERWKQTDNPVTLAGKFSIPVYLGHGADDKMIPPAQTQLFYDALKKAHPALEIVLNIQKGSGHDYTYWGSETKAVLEFFGRQK